MIQNEDPEVLDLQDVTENWIKRNKLYMLKIKVFLYILKMCLVTLREVQSKGF